MLCAAAIPSNLRLKLARTPVRPMLHRSRCATMANHSLAHKPCCVPIFVRTSCAATQIRFCRTISPSMQADLIMMPDNCRLPTHDHHR